MGEASVVAGAVKGKEKWKKGKDGKGSRRVRARLGDRSLEGESRRRETAKTRRRVRTASLLASHTGGDGMTTDCTEDTDEEQENPVEASRRRQPPGEGGLQIEDCKSAGFPP